MKYLFCLSLLLLVASQAFSKPVTSLERLEELKAKLRGLEQELSDYEGKNKLDDSLLSADHVGNYLNNDAKRELQSLDLDDPDFKEFLTTLSENERRVLGKMHSKLHYLKDALSAPTTVNKGDMELPLPARRGLQPDVVLEEFLKSLSEEDRAIVNKLQSKLKYLLAALLDKTPSDPLDIEHPVVRRRQLLDEVLQGFIDNLSEEDKAIVLKIQSKLKYLLAAINNNDAGDPLDVESQVPARRSIALPPAALRELSPADRQLVLRHPSKLALLENALKATTGENAEDSKSEKEKRHNGPIKGATNVNGKWGSHAAPDSELGLLQEKRCGDGNCKNPSIRELAHKIAADLRASKGDSLSLEDILERVQSVRRRMEN